MKNLIAKYWTPNKKSIGLMLAGILGLLWTSGIIDEAQFAAAASGLALLTGVRMAEKGKPS